MNRTWSGIHSTYTFQGHTRRNQLTDGAVLQSVCDSLLVTKNVQGTHISVTQHLQLLPGLPGLQSALVRSSTCPYVCHMLLSPKLSEIDIWLLGNSNTKLGFPIQNLPSHSQSEVRFRYLGVSQLALRPFRQKWAVGLVSGSVGTVTSLDTRPALPVSSCTSSYAQLHWGRTQPRLALWRAIYRHVP